MAVVPATLLGWWSTTCGLEAWEAARVRAALVDQALPRPRVDGRAALEPLPYPRWIRQARGVGARRSVDVARFLWSEGRLAPIENVRGIGPVTARAVRQALSRPEPSPRR